MPSSTLDSVSGKIRVLQAPALLEIPWLVHGFSRRSGGFSRCYGGKTLNLGFTPEDDAENVARNRRLLLHAVGAAGEGQPWPLMALRQAHSDLIQVVDSALTDSPLPPDGPPVADGLVTHLPRIALAIQTADCFPILLADARNRVVAGFHAGWRGTMKRIVEKGLGVMRCQYGTRQRDIYAVLGPGIRKCCYAVGEEVKGKFESQFNYAHELFEEVDSARPIREKYPLLFMSARPPGHGDMGRELHLDLAEANRRQLVLAGVPAERITVLPHCTSCERKNFFSHRADGGHTGRMMAVIGMTQAR